MSQEEIAKKIAGYDRFTTIEMMKKSIDYMAAICLPEVCTEFFPDLYQYAWERYTEELMKEGKEFPQFALSLPRGHAKTMFIKLLCVFCVLFTSRQFVAVICASAEKAEDIVTDFENIMDGKNIQAIFGNWRLSMQRDKLGYLKFEFNGRKRIFLGLGQDSSFRGTNIENLRPDVMVFDDAQSAKMAESAEQSRKFIRKFFGTMLKAKSPKRCFYLFVGNMYPNVVIERNELTGKTLYACLLRNLKDNPQWETIIVGGILADGSALWEAVHSLKQLLKEFVNDYLGGAGDVFAAEVLNDPDFTLLEHFDPSKVPAFPYDEDSVPLGRFIVVDPSLGKKKSDDQIFGLFDVYDGYPVYSDFKKVMESAPSAAQTLLAWAAEVQAPLIAIESYAYQGSLIQWLEFWLQAAKVTGLKIVPITRGAETKNQSILGYFKELQSGEAYIAEKIRSLVYDQIFEFNPKTDKNRDDILDVGAYGNKVLLKYRQEVAINLIKGEYDRVDDPDDPAVIDAGLYYGVGNG